MKHIYFSALIILLVNAEAMAQSPCCFPFLRDGNILFEKNKYTQAREEYKAGLDCILNNKSNQNESNCIELKKKLQETERIIDSISRKDLSDNKELKDLILWNSVKDSKYPEDIRKKYLEKCTLCRYKDAAETLIQNLELAEDARLWNSVKNSNNPKEIRELYINHCTICEFKDEAKNLINKLEAVEDNRLWNRVKNSKNPEEIREVYIYGCSTCKYKAEAQNLIKNLEEAEDMRLWNSVKNSEDPFFIQDNYLDQCNEPCKHQKDAENRISELINTFKPDLAYIQGSKFIMGNNFDKKIFSDVDPHTVSLISFYIGVKEVTFLEYDVFCFDTNREKPLDDDLGRGLNPVVNVTWYDAIDYCNWRSKKDGFDTVYVIGGQGQIYMNLRVNGYRLPTESEWECAARGGATDVRFGNGQNVINYNTANFDATSNPYAPEQSTSRRSTVPVASLGNKNNFGLYDMCGNALEWCWDWYDPKYYEQFGRKHEVKNSTGPERGIERTLRGGGWNNGAERCAVYFRHFFKPTFKRNYIGFRVVRNK